MEHRFQLVTFCVLLCGCLLPRPEAVLPPVEDGYVAVFSGEMPPPIDLVARHAWLIVQLPGGAQHRYEYAGGRGDPEPFADFTGGDIMVHGVLHESAAELNALVTCLDEASAFAEREFPNYVPIPGPNSNTYIDVLLRRCAIPVELPATAIGRDYRGRFGVSLTESRLGVQVETPVLGLRVGLVDGLEVHLVGLVLGVHFWPPGITVPVNPGRIGFSTDGHHPRPHDLDLQPPRDEPLGPRRYGLGEAWLSVSGARPVAPDLAGGLQARGTFGAQARGLYGSHFGYGAGFDFEFGMGWPASFAYGVHLYPAGFGVMFGPTGYWAIFGGLGTSGDTTVVSPALELPLETRLEFDVTRYARVGLRAQASWNVGPATRHHSSLAPHVFDELTFGGFVRLGKTRRYSSAVLGSGYFVGVERRELRGTAMWGLSFGVESEVAQ